MLYFDEIIDLIFILFLLYQHLSVFEKYGSIFFKIVADTFIPSSLRILT